MTVNADQHWHSVSETAAVLAVSTDALYKRVQRHGDSPLIRREPSSDDGGRPRVLIHSELLDRWATASSTVPDTDAASIEVLEQSVRHSEIVAQHAQLESRDREIDMLKAALIERDQEIAALREAVQALTRPRTGTSSS